MDPLEIIGQIIQETTEAIVQRYATVLLEGQLLQTMILFNVALFAAFAAGYWFCMTLRD